MDNWNIVLTTALLGTEKRNMTDVIFDPELAENIKQIHQLVTDREDAFLQSAALIQNYRQSGFLPVRKPEIDLLKALAEEKNYVSPLANTVLNEIVECDSQSLLRFWLEKCVDENRIVEPEIIPLLMSIGEKHAALRPLINSCCGNRGHWLQQLNNDWNWERIAPEDIWGTGTLAERKQYLHEIRIKDPGLARELLQSVWPQESAATRFELLAKLLTNAGIDDLPWLETLLKEKATRVREAALAIMKSIPQSSIVQNYWRILQQSIRIVHSKGLLGIGAKSELEIQLIDGDDQSYKSGIKHLSSQANVSDEAFILYQLVAAVPPSLWEQEFQLDIATIVQLFAKNKKFPLLISSLATAASNFPDIGWLREIIAVDKSNLYEYALEVLPQAEAERYALRFFDSDEQAAIVVHYSVKFKSEWSREFALALLTHTAKNVYQYHRMFYNELAVVLPLWLIDQLQNCAPKEEQLRAVWTKHQELLQKLLVLKKQTLISIT